MSPLFKAHMAKHFEIKDLGLLKYFLKIELVRSYKGIYLNLRKYTLDIIINLRIVNALMDQNHDLLGTTTSPFLVNVAPYRCLVSRLIYLAITCPHLSYAAFCLSFCPYLSGVTLMQFLKLFVTLNINLVKVYFYLLQAPSILQYMHMLIGVNVPELVNPSLDTMLF